MIFNIKRFLTRICFQSFAAEIWGHLKPYIKDEIQEEEREALLKGAIPLDYSIFCRYVDLSRYPVRFILPYNRRKFTSQGIAHYLWDFDGKSDERHHWDDKPFRLLSKSCAEYMSELFGESQGRAFTDQLVEYFLRCFGMFPQPVNRSFYA